MMSDLSNDLLGEFDVDELGDDPKRKNEREGDRAKELHRIEKYGGDGEGGPGGR